MDKIRKICGACFVRVGLRDLLLLAEESTPGFQVTEMDDCRILGDLKFSFPGFFAGIQDTLIFRSAWVLF